MPYFYMTIGAWGESNATEHVVLFLMTVAVRLKYLHNQSPFLWNFHLSLTQVKAQTVSDR